MPARPGLTRRGFLAGATISVASLAHGQQLERPPLFRENARNVVFEAMPTREAATSVAYEPEHVPNWANMGTLETGLGEMELADIANSTTPGGYEAILETICGGVDDTQDVELYDGTQGVSKAFVHKHQVMVGQLKWNNDLASKYPNPGNVSDKRWCSGTLISDNLFLSAGHCFDQEKPFSVWKLPRSNNGNKKIEPPEIAKNMHVSFNYQFDPQGKLRTEQRFPIEELIEHRVGQLDYAIVRLGGNPGRTLGRTTIADKDVAIGDSICIIGHPLGLPKRVMAGPTTDFQDTRIGYNTIDTFGGNSGSGILSIDGEIIGVHTNGGCDVPAIGHNYGVRISSLLAVSGRLRSLA